MFEMGQGREGLSNRRRDGIRLEDAREPGAHTRHLQADEEQRLPAVSPPWLKAYIVVAIESCCRRGELAAATWGDADLTRQILTLRETKNGDINAQVPLSAARWPRWPRYRAGSAKHGFSTCTGM